MPQINTNSVANLALQMATKTLELIHSIHQTIPNVKDAREWESRR